MMHRNHAEIAHSYIYNLLGIPKASFYSWKKQALEVSPKPSRREQIEAFIREEYQKSKSTYGSPRMRTALDDRGIKVSENTIAKYMRSMKLSGDRRKKRRLADMRLKRAETTSERLFKTEEGKLPDGPRKVLVGDITELKSPGLPRMYLAAVMDLFSRKIVGWSLEAHQKTPLICNAMQSVRHEILSGVTLFHSDRGSQYCSQEFRELLKDFGITQSMSRSGRCHDNAHMESFFGTFKSECFKRHKPKSLNELRELVFDYIDVRYNTERIHSSLGGISPQQKEEQYRRQQSTLNSQAAAVEQNIR